MIESLERKKLKGAICLSPQMSIAGVFLIAFLWFATTAYADSFKGPWGKEKPRKIAHQGKHHASNPLRLLVEVYRDNISPIDGKRCPMYPSCSTYSVESFKKHGFFVGWMMTCDRLYRCGRDELRLSPEVRIDDEIRTYDPVENNDFWWYRAR